MLLYVFLGWCAQTVPREIVERVKAYRSHRFIQYTDNRSAGETSISNRTRTTFAQVRTFPCTTPSCLILYSSQVFVSEREWPSTINDHQRTSAAFDSKTSFYQSYLLWFIDYTVDPSRRPRIDPPVACFILLVQRSLKTFQRILSCTGVCIELLREREKERKGYSDRKFNSLTRCNTLDRLRAG